METSQTTNKQANMCNNKLLQNNNINIHVEDIVLTPLTCARLISEILKCLVYQKSQIPYPYTWLKSAINKKRKNTEPPRLVNFTVQRHYLIASKAFDTLEDVMANISKVFETSCDTMQELLIIFGSTPVTPKEIFTIRIPTIARGHLEANHLSTIQKSQHVILRNIFLSDVWLNSMENPLTATNMYLMINKSTKPDTDFFIANNYAVPSNVKNTVISLIYNEINDVCCEHLRVFEDGEMKDEITIEDRVEENCKDLDGAWYQANVIVKGFRDCFINKVSASEIW